MARTVGIGIQDFGSIIEKNCFYVDKTTFIKDWWESEDAVTLITRPRRFGKTLTMSMMERFFSIEYKDNGSLFEGLSIYKEKKYRELQGTIPVISLSFAGVKETDFITAREKIIMLLIQLYRKYTDVICQPNMSKEDVDAFQDMLAGMQNESLSSVKSTFALNLLSELLSKVYQKKVIILMDEYDTPLQEAYVNGYWDDMVAYTRSLFNNAFKTNPYMERAIMTGVTRVSKESIFSDLNNLEVVTTTSDKYATTFGFTENEVFAAMDEMGLPDRDGVKHWYDGFTFGEYKDIYNPWSILNYLDKGKYDVYWANTSKNSLVATLIRTADIDIKSDFQILLEGGEITTPITEDIVYDDLDNNAGAIWSLLLASGYLKVMKVEGVGEEAMYTLSLTNFEVSQMFRKMVKGWFRTRDNSQNRFLNALLSGDIEGMNYYLNKLTNSVFSFYDVGNGEKWEKSENFYHGFVIGLMVELDKDYEIKSNRESGLGRYDVMLLPKTGLNGIIIEFKAVREEKGETLENAVQMALQQIEDKKYEQELLMRGVPESKIRKYGFAFEGKNVLIGCLLPENR